MSFSILLAACPGQVNPTFTVFPGAISVKIVTAWLYLLTLTVVFCISGCSIEASRVGTSETTAALPIAETSSIAAAKGPVIEIKPGSPAETVLAFYTKLREKRFREAIFLTNLRPAIEGLTDDELKEFAVDFEAIATFVPAEIEINGEIISGHDATVTAKLPDSTNEKLEVQQIRLRKDADHWLIISADDGVEAKIKKDGKSYFQNLRIDTHHTEAKKMLDRIAKAQMVFSLQNKGEYAEFGSLVGQGLLPWDVTSSASTGYDYSVKLATDRKGYRVSATPATYGKSGKLSYLLYLDNEGKPRVKSGDTRGKMFDK